MSARLRILTLLAAALPSRPAWAGVAEAASAANTIVLIALGLGIVVGLVIVVGFLRGGIRVPALARAVAAEPGRASIGVTPVGTGRQRWAMFCYTVLCFAVLVGWTSDLDEPVWDGSGATRTNVELLFGLVLASAALLVIPIRFTRRVASSAAD